MIFQRRIRYRQLAGLLFTAASFLTVPSASQALPPGTRSSRPNTGATRTQLVETYSRQPLSFEANQGQFDPRVQFVSQGLGYTLLLTPSEAEIALQKISLRMKLEGANSNSAATGVDEAPGKANYFIGNDPAKWKKDLSSFSKVKYSGIYPGVDLIYYGNQRQLEYDFLVAPGANPKNIALAIEGAKSFRIDRNGDLVLKFPAGEMRLRKPVVYQNTEAETRNTIDGRYVLRAHHRIGFQLGAYDRAKPLIIDPVVTFATYFGGDKDINGQPAVTDGFGIAVDPNDNIYITGSTNAVNDGVFPILNAKYPAPPTTTALCGDQNNAFVAKLDSAGNRVYVTYLGGTQCNNGLTIAADALGNALATGFTFSTDFPVTPGAFQATKPSPGNNLAVYLTEFDPTGHLTYSTFIAAGARDYVAVDQANNFYVTGDTDATFSSHITPGAYQTSCSTSDTFILKFSPAASLQYASCLGNNTGGGAIAVDNASNIYVAGGANPGTGFVVKNGFQTTVSGKQDVYVAKLFPGGQGAADLLYSTLFGGTLEDDVSSIAVDSSGNAWIAGDTGSADLPVTLTAIRRPACLPHSVSTCTGWVAEVNTTASGAASRVFATYLGGSSGDDSATSVVFDKFSGNAFVAGFTASADFPSVNPISGCTDCVNGDESMFVTEFNATGTILFSTFLGGSTFGSDEAFALALDSSGNLFLTGETASESLPPTPASTPNTPIPACMNPLQPQSVGGLDAFVVKLSPSANAQNTTTSISSSVDPSVFGQSVNFTATVNAVVCTSGTPAGTVNFLDGATLLGSQTLTNNSAIFGISGLSVGGHNITASYLGNGSFTTSTSSILAQTVNLAATDTIVTSSVNPASPGQAVTFTATVSPIAPGVGIPTGTVKFFDGATPLGPVALTAGVAAFGTSTLSIGSHTITASYGGDSDFAPSLSGQFIEQIAVLPPSMSKTFGAALIVQGFSASLTFTITNSNPFAALSGVSFLDNLPAGLVVATPNGMNGSCGGGVISAVAGSFAVSLTGATLSPGANCIFSVNVTGTTPGIVTNTTQNVTSSNGGTGNQASAVISVLPAVVAINVAESITVTDSPQVPNVFINVAEAIKVTDAPATFNTLAGSNIVVTPVDTTTSAAPVTLTFSNVTQPGITSLTTTTGGPPPPSGFQLGNPAVYYNLSTTAVYSGTIQLCFHYAGITFQTPPGPRLFHYQNGSWVDVTASVDTVNLIVCGSSASLSPFGLFQSSIVAAPTITSISAPGVTYGMPATATVSVTSPSGTVIGSVSLSVDGGLASTMPLNMGLSTFTLGILNAGPHSLAASFAGQGNFPPSSGGGLLSVAPAPLTIAANNAQRPYGASNPLLTGLLSGLQNGDAITASFTTAALPATPVGNYPITPVALDPANRLGNYTVALVNGTLTIVADATSLTVTLAPGSVPIGQSSTATLTLTAPDMVIPIDPRVLAPLTLASPVVSDILANNGRCTPVPLATPGTASCTVTITSVEPNGRTLNANFPGSTNLAASSGTADLIVTAALQGQQTCISSDFRNVAVGGGNYLWFNSIFKVRDVANKQKINISFFKSNMQFQYKDVSGKLVTVNQPMPDARIIIDPSATMSSTTFDAANNVWITTLPWDLDDNAFLTGMPSLVPAGGIPADVEPVTACGTFASDTAGIDIGWRWAAAAYSSFSSDNTVLGVKPMDTDNDNPPKNHDRAGTPENFKQFTIPGARGKGGTNYTGTYSLNKEIE